MADAPADETKKFVENRINQQTLLWAFCDKLDQYYYQKYAETFNEAYTNIYPIRDRDLGEGADSPLSIMETRDKSVGITRYDKKDLNLFLNSLNPIALSMLQPYIHFSKPLTKDKTLVLNLEDANRAITKAFVAGHTMGKGTIGKPKESCGGFGIKSFDLEYLVNKESGYLFNLYKMHVEIFFGSLEDVIVNVGDYGHDYTPIDVLIASSEEISAYLLQNGTSDGSSTSTLHKVNIEIGYSVDDLESLHQPEKNDVKREWFRLLARNNGIAFDKFKELIQKFRFKLEAHAYKWVWDVQENGNILLKIDYYGSDRGLGTHPASNILVSNRMVDELAAMTTPSPAQNKPEQTKQEKDKADKEKSAEVKTKRSEMRVMALQYPYTAIAVRNELLGLRVAAASLEGGSITDALSNVGIYSYGAEPTLVRIDLLHTLMLYDFKKVLNAETRNTSLIVNTRKSTNWVDSAVDKMTITNWGSSPDPQYKDTAAIKFFYLGDLLSVFAKMATENFVYQNVIDKAKGSKTSSFLPYGSSVEFILGEIEITVPTGYMQTRKKRLSLGAVPISWDVFLDFWTKKVLANPNLVYKLEEFLQDFIGYFFKEVLQTKDAFNLDKIEIGCHVIARPLGSATYDSPVLVSYYLYQNSYTDHEPLKLFIGNSRGMMKSCKFAVEEDQYMASYQMAGAVEGEEEQNNLQVQRAIYNVNIELYGNTILQPGMLIEVVPSIVGADMEHDPSFKNLYDLGVGGLYNVVSTAVKLDAMSGVFTTSLHAKYFGKPLNQKPQEYSEFKEMMEKSRAKERAAAVAEYEKSKKSFWEQ
jgi:hypothetical protein